MSFTRLLIVVFSLILVGCTSQAIKSQPSPTKINYPYWVMNPKLEGYLTAVGSAMPQQIGGLEGQRRVALLRARADLAKEARIYVSKEFVVEKQSDSSQPQVSQQINTRAVELQQLDRATIKAEWINKKTGELFIWFVVPLKTVNSKP